MVGWVGMGLSELVNLNVLRIFRVIRLLRAGAVEGTACCVQGRAGAIRR